MSIKDVLDKRG